jgi:hypothetical protein
MRSHGSFTLQQGGKLLLCGPSASHGTSSAEGRLVMTVTRRTRGTRARYRCLPNKPVVETVWQLPYWNGSSRFSYEACLESIQPFWMSRKPVAWPWCNLAASQRRPYCASVNKSLSRGASQSAVRCHWLSLCTVWPSHSQISSLSTAILIRSRREPNLGCWDADRTG